MERFTWYLGDLPKKHNSHASSQYIRMCFGGKHIRGDRLSAQGVGLVILNRDIRADFPKKVTFEPRLEGGCRVCCFAS